MNRFCNNLYRLFIDTDKEKNIQEIIKSIQTEINATPSGKIPRSISLFQYFLAILICNKIIEFPIKNYYCHITEELTNLYPDLQRDDCSVFLYNDG